jgi:hypothetical protein
VWFSLFPSSRILKSERSLNAQQVYRHLYVKGQNGSWIKRTVSQQEESYSSWNPHWNQPPSWRRYSRILNRYALLAQAKFYRYFDPPPKDREVQSPDGIDKAILQALAERPFPSLRQIAKRISVLMVTVWYRLVRKMA